MQQPGLRHLILPGLLALAGFALRAAPPASLGLEAEDALRQLGGICGWLGLAWAAARLADLLLRRASARRTRPYPRLLGDLLRVLLFTAAGVGIVTQVFHQPAFGLITTSSVALAIIGLALRSILSDIFSGLALSLDHPYRIGDWIETAQGAAGRVTEIGWRATRLVTREGFVLVVPNARVADNRLANYGPQEGRYRVSLRIPLDPALPPERARRVLLAGAMDAGRNIPELAPDVVLQEIAEGAAVYLVRFHVPNYGREAACRDAVAAAVLRALQHVGMSVARPAMDLQLARSAPPAQRPRRSALLRRIGLFGGFNAEERAALEQAMRERLLPPGATIVRQGEPGHSLMVLAEGVLDVQVEREGRSVTVDRMVPGDVFGEMSLLTGQARSATVIAATEAVVFEIDKTDLDPLLRQRPELMEGLARMMAQRQARNAERGRPDDPVGQAAPVGAEDLLGRLRQFFRLG